MHRNDLLARFEQTFQSFKYKDAAENGLQIAGQDEIKTVVCGVSANVALIEEAIRLGAQAIFVHHGIVWGGGIRTIDGWLKKRIKLLLQHDISLFAYHLPLDAHPTLGNNIGLVEALGMQDDPSVRLPFANYKGQNIGWMGPLHEACTLDEMCIRISQNIGPVQVCFGNRQKQIRTVGVCSGGAPDILYEAQQKNLDLCLTGEATEWVQAVALEGDTAFIAAGHHATERFGARRVARWLADPAQGFGLQATFIDIPNPV